MATNTRYKGFSDLLKVVNGGIYDGQNLDINNNLCSVTGLPPVLKANNLGDPDYKEPVFDPISCPGTVTVYNSYAQTGSAQKDDCTNPGEVGTIVPLTIPYGAFTSTESQNAANLLAINELNANLQSNANANGTCVLDSPAFISVIPYGADPQTGSTNMYGFKITSNRRLELDVNVLFTANYLSYTGSLTTYTGSITLPAGSFEWQYGYVITDASPADEVQSPNIYSGDPSQGTYVMDIDTNQFIQIQYGMS